MNEELNNNNQEFVPECKCKCTCTGKLLGETTRAVTNTVLVKAKDMCEPNGDCAEVDLKIRNHYTLTIMKNVCPEIAE